MFLTNKRQNGWTDRDQILCGTSRDPREGLWMIKITKICQQQNSIYIKFRKSTIFKKKIRKLFCLFLFLFTIEIKDGGKAPLKPSNKYSKIQFNKENVPMGPSIGFYVM